MPQQHAATAFVLAIDALEEQLDQLADMIEALPD